MAYPTVTNIFSSGTTAIASQWNTNYTDIINGLSDGTKNLNINNLTVNNVATIAGDLYTVGFSDFGAANAIGWNPLTTSNVFYKKVGKTVFIYYILSGVGAPGVYENVIYIYLPFNVTYSLNRAFNSKGKLVYNYINTPALGAAIGYIYPFTNNLAQIVYSISNINWTSSAGLTKFTSGIFTYETAD